MRCDVTIGSVRVSVRFNCRAFLVNYYKVRAFGAPSEAEVSIADSGAARCAYPECAGLTSEQAIAAVGEYKRIEHEQYMQWRRDNARLLAGVA